MKQEQPTKREHFPERICCYFDEFALKKTNFKKTERAKRLQIRGNLLPKYGWRRRDSQVLVTQKFQSFVVNMRWRQSSSLDSENCEEPSLVEKDEEYSDIDAQCLYCSGLYTRDRRGEKWIKCTKQYKWCHEKRSGTDEWTTFLFVFWNIE